MAEGRIHASLGNVREILDRYGLQSTRDRRIDFGDLYRVVEDKRHAKVYLLYLGSPDSTGKERSLMGEKAKGLLQEHFDKVEQIGFIVEVSDVK